ncbi:hypothetical protein L6164_030663 [Bauhinia variegata]|uniref:Uncharacterized protein n=1 Tax=Bauhinia variegata TaxID=167791 RepID=A0ACB9LED8_BAUVA|nr:hypothetical protein L6164_030663 [Bauhinia variegata]
MRVTGDIGFSSLVLVVVCLVIPIIGFVIRRKWHHAVARKEEIKRLLILASEEAARAELEASYEHGTVSFPKNNQCAVCYRPTTTRCARCKAVRYCSGKCQIIHWRQGHKEECCPPSTTHRDDDVVRDSGKAAAEQGRLEIHGELSDLGKKPTKQDHFGIQVENSKIEGTHSELSSKKPSSIDISCSSEVSCGKDDNIRVEPLAEGSIADSNSESSCDSFSGFSASNTSSESSDDASVCESIISNEHERSEKHTFVSPTLHMLDTTSGDNSVGITVPSSPKFAALLDSVDGFSTMDNFNQIRSGFIEESKLASNGTSGLRTCKGAMNEHCMVSSSFWDKALDLRGSTGDADGDSLPFDSNKSTGDIKSESGSSLLFSSRKVATLDARDPEAKSSFSDYSSLNPVKNNIPSARSVLQENGCKESSKMRCSSSINSKGSDSDSTSHSDKLDSRSYVHKFSSIREDSGCADASSPRKLQPVESKASNHVLDGPGSTSHLLKSVEVIRVPHAFADAQLDSRTEEQTHSNARFVNNGVQSSTTASSQVASCSPNSKNGLKTSVLKVVDQFRGSNLSKRSPLAVGSNIAGRYSDKGLFPYDLFVKLFNSNKVELRPFGLINCGNSCYANAVLQCLAFSPPLTAYLLQGLHSKACVKKKWCFTCEFESLVLKSKEGKSPLSPMGILSQLQNIGSQLGNGREEDAHEFLRHVIDTMQSICLMEAGINASGSLEEETTLMGLTFGGYLRSKIKCMKCGGKSERQERMMDLTVEIEGEITTLEEALRQFTKTETLDGENKYHCVRCKSYEKAKKKMTISEAPNVLTVALKRFKSGRFGKLNKPVQFPEILDLAPFMSGTSDKSPIYRLYGAIIHLDVMNAAFSGHYVCYVKNFQNKWFKVDDSVVTAVELERVLSKGAYMLLYARCSPRAPRLIRNMIVSSDSRSKAMNGKTILLKSKCVSANSGAAEYFNDSVSPDASPTLDSFYSNFHRLRKILSEDSSSDNSSLISSNSDEGSCSTDSTRDSTSTDDLSDYIFGDSGQGCCDTCSSSSSSPMYSRHSPLADMDRHDSGSTDAAGLQTHTDPHMEINGLLYRRATGISGVVGREEGVSIRHSDTSILQHMKLDSSRRSVSSFSETNPDPDPFQRLGSNHCNDINSVLSSRERTG